MSSSTTTGPATPPPSPATATAGWTSCAANAASTRATTSPICRCRASTARTRRASTADGAVYAREDGIVIIDPEKAKGNQEIVDSCPYGAICWNEELQLAQKCIFCAHLIDDPTWTPHTTRCAHACPTDAMKTYFVEPAEMDKMIAAEGLEAYKAELGTKPSTLYKNLHKFTKNFITAGVLVDGDCFEGADCDPALQRGRHRVHPVRRRRGQLQRHLGAGHADHQLLRGVQVRRPG